MRRLCPMRTLECAECGSRSDQRAQGWRAYLADGLEEDEDVEVVTVCPECADREFGLSPRG